ncbi:hypothetical protein AVEN_105142-1 [Araneus ventricosus]|uniref:Uncharacterized protein n=1 Tax=Araneus ventricosus TaxID=182803 RepID=A0A4Y2VC90_ARAVE|nr:hypothetical protein AVEN_131434-1 [Araneus ventricosus]GBO21706.1 hypothetical protein AVEN_105142-1 [Araneus ventricosus]
MVQKCKWFETKFYHRSTTYPGLGHIITFSLTLTVTPHSNTLHHSNFQPSMLGRSLTGRTAPTTNSHVRALRPPRATSSIPPPSTNGTLAVVFAFEREPYFLYPTVAFIMVEHSKWISSEVGFPTF